MPPTHRELPRTTPAIQAEPNVVPMIDVLLVLLIIFMAAIPARQKMLEGQLPIGEEAAPGAPAIVLEVGPDGRYAINRRPVPAAALAGEIAALYHGRPNSTLLVKGAPGARYHEVMTAADIARGAGVRVVGFDTRRE